MTDSYKHWATVALICSLMACGAKTVEDEAPPSNWLIECSTDAECVVGACSCGRCTQPCEAVTDCPYPLDQCIAPGSGPFDNSCDVPSGGLCSIFDERRLQSVHALRQRAVSKCDQGRSTRFVVEPNIEGQMEAVAINEREFYVFGSLSDRVVRVDTSGAVLQVLQVPSDLGPWMTSVWPLADGRVVLVGSVESFAGWVAWVGLVDEDWQLVWEQEIRTISWPTAVRLEDGDLVLVSVALPDPDAYIYNPEPPGDVGMLRIDLDGNIQWESHASIATLSAGGPPAVVGTQSCVIVQTHHQTLMVAATDDGELIQTPLELDPARRVLDTVAIPGDRLAVASSSGSGASGGNATVTVLEANGDVGWQRNYAADEGAFATGIAYDGVQEQILVAGGYAGKDGGKWRTWMIATNLLGEQEWELTRLPQEIDSDGKFTSVSPVRGPELNSVAVGVDGTLLAVGAPLNQLSFFVVAPERCE